MGRILSEFGSNDAGSKASVCLLCLLFETWRSEKRGGGGEGILSNFVCKVMISAKLDKPQIQVCETGEW